jgi:hypothetical protein
MQPTPERFRTVFHTLLTMLLPLLLTAASAASAQSVYTGYSETAFQTLQSWYNEDNGLWDTCGWWNGANCMTVVADLAAADDTILSTATSIFAHTYTAAPASNPQEAVLKISEGRRVETVYGPPSKSAGDLESRDPNPNGFVDSCYDDNGWWALAWIAAYDLTQNSDYINTAAGIFDEMTGGGPTNCSNGGIIWCSTGSYYVNAIANELVSHYPRLSWLKLTPAPVLERWRALGDAHHVQRELLHDDGTEPVELVQELWLDQQRESDKRRTGIGLH